MYTLILISEPCKLQMFASEVQNFSYIKANIKATCDTYRGVPVDMSKDLRKTVILLWPGP